jgi:hypothetical protein
VSGDDGTDGPAVTGVNIYADVIRRSPRNLNSGIGIADIEIGSNRGLASNDPGSGRKTGLAFD